MVSIAVLMTALGAAMGSFAGALAWRLHSGRDFVADRSECEHCHHKLGPTDLVPIVSWLILRGRCRYCRGSIGVQPLMLELAMAALFAVSYMYWPLGYETWQAITLFALWLIYLVILGALLIYDLRWMLLPDKLVVVLVGLACVDVVVRCTFNPTGEVVISALLGLIPITGLYGLLYVVSGGRWVGLGDVKLGIFMGLILGWQKALLVLLLANVIGFILLVPGLLSGKVDRKSHVPFGPFLIIGFIIAGLFGGEIIRWVWQSAFLLPY